MKPTRPRRELFECPHCGADVAVGARVCRECGSDADTGWQSEEQIDYAQVDLPDGYRDDGLGDELPPVRTKRWVALVAGGMALLLILLWLRVWLWF